MNNLIFLLIFGGCSSSAKHITGYEVTHMGANIRSTEVIYPVDSDFKSIRISDETLAYSKKINYWVEGKWVGRGKNRYYIAGHWEKRVAVPPSNHGYMWAPGRYTRKPSKAGRPRGWVPGHWEKK